VFAILVPGVLATPLHLLGSCAGTELRLASDAVPFGPVVLGSRAVKRVAVENSGDVGTRFKWDATALGPHFSITPLEGFLVSVGEGGLCEE
jgi:hydrocephalus-inducing protein